MTLFRNLAAASRVLALWLLAAGPNVSATPEPVRIDPAAVEIHLSSALLVIPDQGRALDIDAVAAGHHDGDAMSFKRLPPNLGYPRQAYWVRLRLSNPTAQALDRLLVLWRGASQAQTIRIDSGADSRIARLGHGADRVGDVLSRHQALRLELPAHGTVQITARVESWVALVLDYRLLTDSALLRHDSFDHATFGVLIGALFSMGLFVLAVWIGVRERSFLYFTGFSWGILIYYLHSEAYAYMLSPRWQFLGGYVSACSGAFQSICMLLMVREFAITSQSARRFDRFVVVPLAIAQSLIVVLYPIRPWLGNTVVALAVVLNNFTLVALLLLNLFSGRRMNVAFMLALLLQVTSVALFLLKRVGVIPDLTVFTILVQLATLFSALMFAIAISQRVRRIARENAEAQVRYAQQLEQEVESRTSELSGAKHTVEKALDELREAQHHLVQSEKMASLGQLVAGVAHEVNTPLGVALTASSFLGQHSKDVEARAKGGGLRKSELDSFFAAVSESTDMIERNLGRAAQLVQSFKQVSVDRTSDGQRQFDLAQFLAELVESLQPTLKQRPIALHLSCAPDLLLDSFPGALGQVLTILLQNALIHAFAAEQPGRIRLLGRALDADRVVIEFSDDGRGVDAEALAKVFDPFYTTRRGQGGTGLGLHVAMNLVTQKLRGTISAHSASGQGMRLVMRLPRGL